jgi:hypothetical protein
MRTRGHESGTDPARVASRISPISRVARRRQPASPTGPVRSLGFPRQQSGRASSLVCAHLREDAGAMGRPELPPISPKSTARRPLCLVEQKPPRRLIWCPLRTIWESLPTVVAARLRALWKSSGPGARSALRSVAARPREREQVRLQVVADQAGSKHTGDSRNRGKGGQPVWPITTPDRRGHRDAHLWRQARRSHCGRSRPAFAVAQVSRTARMRRWVVRFQQRRCARRCTTVSVAGSRRRLVGTYRCS